MSNIAKLPVALVVSLFLAACVTDSGPKQTAGTLLGAGVGGLLGAQVGSGSGQLAATAAGALLGAYLGSEIGKSLDKADQQYAEQSAHNALEYAPSGTTSTWTNPDNGHAGTFTPTSTYAAAGDQPCREYKQTVTIDGQTQEAYGTACREPDGAWRIVN